MTDVNSLEQLRRLNTIQNLEDAIIALQNRSPVHPRVLETLQLIHKVFVQEYNEDFYGEPEDEEPEAGEDDNGSEGGEPATTEEPVLKVPKIGAE